MLITGKIGCCMQRRIDVEEIDIEPFARDHADRTRPVSPLKLAPDASLLDTSALDIDAAFAAALALVEPKVKSALKARHRG